MDPPLYDDAPILISSFGSLDQVRSIDLTVKACCFKSSRLTEGPMDPPWVWTSSLGPNFILIHNNPHFLVVSALWAILG